MGNRASLFSTLIVALIPKCYLCMTAYSGAIAVCGGRSVMQSHSKWILYIPILFAWLVVTVIARKKRGIRTIYAVLLAGGGAVLTSLASGQFIASSYYDIGTALLFFAVWLNSSFLYFISTITERLRKRKLLWQK